MQEKICKMREDTFSIELKEETTIIIIYFVAAMSNVTQINEMYYVLYLQ